MLMGIHMPSLSVGGLQDGAYIVPWSNNSPLGCNTELFPDPRQSIRPLDASSVQWAQGIPELPFGSKAQAAWESLWSCLILTIVSCLAAISVLSSEQGGVKIGLLEKFMYNCKSSWYICVYYFLYVGCFMFIVMCCVTVLVWLTTCYISMSFTPLYHSPGAGTGTGTERVHGYEWRVGESFEHHHFELRQGTGQEAALLMSSAP
jgi:hypothetical protein